MVLASSLRHLRLPMGMAGLVGIAMLASCCFLAVQAEEAPPADKDKIPAGAPKHPFAKRSPAPSLDGGAGWLNTAGPIDLRDLRGKFVVLDFWTYCCINCIHVLPELKKLEKAYPNNVVVIGVHSAKFDEEKDLDNIRAAILRYEIEHPVLNDPEHKIWEKYFVNSWPSLRIIDPEGNLVAVHSGEVEFAALDGFFKSVLPFYAENKLLDEKPIKFDLEASKATKTPLRFPGKVLADEASQRLFIADSNHNRIVVSSLSGQVQEIIGTGVAGRSDGNYTTAQFDHPQGMALHGETLYVADTENHMLRKVDLRAKTVTTISGNGEQSRNGWPGVDEDESPFNPLAKLPERFVAKPKLTGLNSPWDLWIHDKALYIAMAGFHQIWRMDLAETEIGPFAGNGREHITDGELLPPRPYDKKYSAFAQPSGLSSDGKSLFVADSEGSAVRVVPLDGNPTSTVSTLVGTPNVPAALFNFGDIDGPLKAARMQHCLGVAYHNGRVYVSDTYNNKVKAIDIASQKVVTIAGSKESGLKDGDTAQFDEPAGISAAGGKLYIADTNNHAIRTLDLKTNQVATLAFADLAPPVPPKAATPQGTANKKPTFRKPTMVELKEVAVKPVQGTATLDVKLTLPEGWKINRLAPTVYYVESSAKEGPIDRTALNVTGKNEDGKESFQIPLKVGSNSGSETLTVSMNYYYCLGGPEGECKFGSVVWTVPIKIDPAAEATSVPLKFTVPE